MHWRRAVGIAIATLVTVALIVYGFRPVPQKVDVAEVKRGPLRVAIEEEGKSRVIDRYLISTPVAAYARRIELKVGDQVQKGQKLLTLEPPPSAVLDPRSRATASARVEAARAALESARQQAGAAKAEAELAQRDYERIANLCKVQCASKGEEDQARTKARGTEAQEQSARFAVDVARHELKAAEAALAFAGAKSGTERLAITSPIDGQVLKVIRESEGVTAAGEPLIELGNPRHLEVVADLLSADAVKLAPGTRVLFERWGGDQPLEGQVRTIEPVGFTKVSALGVEEQRVLVISDLTSDSAAWQRLGDGYRVEATFILWEGEDVLTVPASSLFRFEGGWAVFVVEDEHAKRVKVEVGQRNGLSAQVVSGVAAGARVITHPSDAIEDGMKVEVR